jgi:hypothetical protein
VCKKLSLDQFKEHFYINLIELVADDEQMISVDALDSAIQLKDFIDQH